VAVADLDGDSVPGFVTANRGSDNVTVLLNLSGPPVPPIPALGPVGIAILLSLLGATAYSRQRGSGAAVNRPGAL
jgi:hypothetical protein